MTMGGHHAVSAPIVSLCLSNLEGNLVSMRINLIEIDEKLNGPRDRISRSHMASGKHTTGLWQTSTLINWKHHYDYSMPSFDDVIGDFGFKPPISSRHVIHEHFMGGSRINIHRSVLNKMFKLDRRVRIHIVRDYSDGTVDYIDIKGRFYQAQPAIENNRLSYYGNHLIDEMNREIERELIVQPRLIVPKGTEIHRIMQ